MADLHVRLDCDSSSGLAVAVPKPCIITETLVWYKLSDVSTMVSGSCPVFVE